MANELTVNNTCIFALLLWKTREEADARLQGIAGDLLNAAIGGRMAEAVRLSDELLASGRGLDSRDQVGTSCAMPCHAMSCDEENNTQ